MPKFRKKPVVIDAEVFHPDKKPWPEGVKQYEAERTEQPNGSVNRWYGWRIGTLEGWMEVKPGDFIITGVKGERYPCKPDIFELTYDKAREGVDYCRHCGDRELNAAAGCVACGEMQDQR